MYVSDVGGEECPCLFEVRFFIIPTALGGGKGGGAAPGRDAGTARNGVIGGCALPCRRALTSVSAATAIWWSTRPFQTSLWHGRPRDADSGIVMMGRPGDCASYRWTPPAPHTANCWPGTLVGAQTMSAIYSRIVRV
jgi:hypothetical protein